MKRTHLVLIAGFAGSGKTEVARLLSTELRWPILDKDSLTRPVTDRLLQLAGGKPNDRDSDLYLDQVRPLEYEVVEDTAIENIRCGISIIVSAPYLREVRDPSWRRGTELRLAAFNARLRIVWVRCDADTMRDQLVRRDARRDDYKLSHWDTYLKRADVSREADPCDLILDNSVPRKAPLAKLVDDLAELLKRDGA